MMYGLNLKDRFIHDETHYNTGALNTIYKAFMKYYIKNYQMSCVAKKSAFSESDQVRHKPGYRKWLDTGNFGLKKKSDCTIYVAKIKALISCAGSAQLICTFVFTYAKSRFSYDMYHIPFDR